MHSIDLTHLFTENMPMYPGDPKPTITQTAELEKHGYNDFQVTTGMHVGTHIDAPLHMLENGKRLSEIPVEKFFGNGRLIDARGKSSMDASLLQHHSIERGDIVFIFTGWSAKFGQSDYYEKFPEVEEEFARRLIDGGVAILGMDTPSPDRPPFYVHKLLFQHDILIIENLTNLEALLNIPAFEVIALPAKFHTEAAPVRVVARVKK